MFFALTFVYVTFIFYASFSFGGSKPFSLSEGLARLSGIADSFPRLRFNALRDISTNILLYIPLGVLLACWLATLKNLRLRTPWLLFGSGISILVEFTQLFINRYPDPVDVITNTGGFVTGFSLTLWAIRKYRFEVSSVFGLEQEGKTKVRMLQVIRFLYAGIYFIVQLLPLDISVSMTNVYAKLVAPLGVSPRIILDPLYHFQSDAMDWHQILLEFLVILPPGRPVGKYISIQGTLELDRATGVLPHFCLLRRDGESICFICNDGPLPYGVGTRRRPHWIIDCHCQL